MPASQGGAQGAPPLAGQQTFALPMPPRQVAALLQRRDELSNQLSSAQSRRASLARQLQSPRVVNAPGLQAEVQFLDSRILNLEQQIADNGQLLASVPASYGARTSVPPFTIVPATATRDAVDLVVLALVIPLAIAWTRRLWRRPALPSLPANWDESMKRMERIETAVDAIAIEVERVSEGQRFITRVLTARAPATDSAHNEPSEPRALAAGDAPFEPARVRDAAAARRDDG
ncbi:MAG: hypothetical protein ACYCVL_06870 [Gemmatimonadaceae bacterium]